MDFKGGGVKFQLGDKVRYTGNSRIILSDKELTIQTQQRTNGYFQVELKEYLGIWWNSEEFVPSIPGRITKSLEVPASLRQFPRGYEVTLKETVEGHTCTDNLIPYTGLNETFKFCKLCDRKYQ